MAKFKIGDKVRLKEGLKANEWYGDIMLCAYMINEAKSIMNELHVVAITPDGHYLLNTETISIYSEEMLESNEED